MSTQASTSPGSERGSSSRTERVRAIAARHWLGLGGSPMEAAIASEIRTQFRATAHDYYKESLEIYDGLSAKPAGSANLKQPVVLANRSVQLFLSYSLLWEAFQQIFFAASYTHFAKQGAARAALEPETARIDRVLRPPFVEDQEYSAGMVLRNGETADGALDRMLGRRSREMREFYGRDVEQTLTNMEAFLQGQVIVEANNQAQDGEQKITESEIWLARALDENGSPLDAAAQFSPSKYRSVVKCHCWQIRHNLNFVGKSEGSIDDAILMMRAFCLIEPIVALLLQESRKEAIFALD